MSKKLGCFFGVHEYQIIDSRPYEKYWGKMLTATGSWYAMRCAFCGKLKRKILCA